MVNGYAVTAKPVPLSVNLMNCKERYILDYQLIRTNNHILIPVFNCGFLYSSDGKAIYQSPLISLISS